MFTSCHSRKPCPRVVVGRGSIDLLRVDARLREYDTLKDSAQHVILASAGIEATQSCVRLLTIAPACCTRVLDPGPQAWYNPRIDPGLGARGPHAPPPEAAQARMRRDSEA